MSIAYLKEEMLLPERETVINKALELRGNRALIASITLQNDKIILWVFHHQPCDRAREEHIVDHMTNRDEILGRIDDDHTHSPHIREISIQGQELALSSSSIGGISHDHMSYMKLQHFVEAGVDFTSIEDIDLDELALGEYELEEGSPFPEIDPSKEMPVSLRFDEMQQELVVEPAPVFTLSVGEQADTRHVFHNPVEDKPMTFYFDLLECHDLWKEHAEQQGDEKMRQAWREHGMSDEDIVVMLRQHEETLEQVCPRDCDLLLLHYEAENDAQLCFYTLQHLDSPPVIHEGNSVGILFGFSDEEGIHGHSRRVCNLGVIPKGYNKPTTLELVSWYRKIPGETVEA